MSRHLEHNNVFLFSAYDATHFALDTRLFEFPFRVFPFSPAYASPLVGGTNSHRQCLVESDTYLRLHFRHWIINHPSSLFDDNGFYHFFPVIYRFLRELPIQGHPVISNGK